MDIKNKIIDICDRVMLFQNNSRLTRFLILFAQNDAKKDRKLEAYYDKYMKYSNNPSKKLKTELDNLIEVKNGICVNINDWMKDYYNKKELDLSYVCDKKLHQDLSCILLDINLYANENLVSKAFKLLIRNFTQKQDVIELV